jgi:plasmid maintenance system antidote protein VapI
MAMRLARAFETSSESWLNLWQQYELWQARRRENAFKNIPSLMDKCGLKGRAPADRSKA